MESSEKDLPSTKGSADRATEHKHLVVVHKCNRSLLKGSFGWPELPQHPAPLPPLPAVFDIHDEATGTTSVVDLSDLKALLFVRNHKGDSYYEEVKFFSRSEAPHVWVRVQMRDGEVIEGRTENNIALLLQPGFWLWPVDSFSNNLLVYIPKTSVAEFHVMATATRVSPDEKGDKAALAAHR